MRSVRARLLVPVALTCALASAACDDGRKHAEQDAADALAKLAPVLKEDVAQVRRGLPEGAVKLGAMLDPDTLTDLLRVQKAITRTRALVPDLDVAKGTFFSYADKDGKVVRSETDPDLLADKPLFPSFPALKKAADPAGGLTEAWGEMKELRGLKSGADLVWAVAAPVKDDKGQAKGLFVTGWSLRAYARRLETSATATVREAAEKAGKKNPPLVYVFVIKGKTAYGTPLAPDVNAQAIEALDLIGKTAAGAYRGTLEITNRGFGVAGARVPELGDDVALAVLASEI
jgi:hypothetical protein